MIVVISDERGVVWNIGFDDLIGYGAFPWLGRRAEQTAYKAAGQAFADKGRSQLSAVPRAGHSHAVTDFVSHGAP